MSDLPNWVYDVVMTLDKHEAEHPRYYVQGFDVANEHVRAGTCGCQALALVPADVRQPAAAIHQYLEKLPDQPSPADLFVDRLVGGDG